MHLLVPLIVVPMSSGVRADVALERLLPCVPKHVPFQVHTLVAGVGAEAAAERLITRVDAAMALEVGQVTAGVRTQRALVGLFPCVDPLVALEVVQVGRGIGAEGTGEGLLTTMCLHVAGQVVRIGGDKRAELAREAFRRGCLSPQHCQAAAPTHWLTQALVSLQNQTAGSTCKRKEQFGKNWARVFRPQEGGAWQQRCCGEKAAVRRWGRALPHKIHLRTSEEPC